MESRIIVIGALLLASPVLWTACGRVPRKARAKAEALAAPLDGIDLPPDPGAWSAWRNSLAPAGKPGPRLTLARDGRTDYRIVVAKNASSQDRIAAQELQRWLKDMTGAAFQVVSEARLTGKSRKLISVGRTDLLKQSAIPALEDDLAEEGYGIAVKRGTLFLWGGSRRGAINAVFALL
ncbi:MAG TPA: alpha-glucuronidase family glycosyl hydrolase, partial [Sumerlaeia bacterium]|nr:alpha-glucuronidase family glycosyl hydrolase [Sumerlaeia bacterium]